MMIIIILLIIIISTQELLELSKEDCGLNQLKLQSRHLKIFQNSQIKRNCCLSIKKSKHSQNSDTSISYKCLDFAKKIISCVLSLNTFVEEILHLHLKTHQNIHSIHLSNSNWHSTSFVEWFIYIIKKLFTEI